MSKISKLKISNFKSFIRNIILPELDSWLSDIISIIPGIIGVRLRRRIIRFKSKGKNLTILSSCKFYHANKITIGNNTIISSGTVINGAGQIKIGNNVLIGPGVYIWSQNHNFSDKKKIIKEQGYVFKSVSIGDDVWLGANAIVLPGIEIGTGAVVSAGAVVTKNLLPYTVYMGYPARKIGIRK